MTTPANPASPPSPQLVEALGQLGKIVNNASLYGAGHRLTMQAIGQGFALVSTLLIRTPRLEVGIQEGELAVNGRVLASNSPLVKVLALKLANLRINGFALVQGITQAEFNQFIDLLLTSHPGNDRFCQSLKDLHLNHVEPERGEYRRISADEMVVTADDFRDATARAPEPPTRAFVLELDSETAQPGMAADSEAGIQSIMAFLKGEVASPSGQVSDQLKEIASDPEKLASLIMEAAVVRQRSTGLAEGESLGDLIVGCLRRTYQGLSRTAPARPSSDKPTLRKQLLLLEKTLLDRLHAMVNAMDSYEQEISAASLPDESELNAITADYIMRRHAYERSQRKILQLMRESAGSRSESLRLKLQEAGLSVSGWRELVGKSGAAQPASAPPMDLGVFAALLAQLDALMTTSPHKADEAASIMSQVGREVDKLADTTSQKIDVLGRNLSQKRLDQAQSGRPGDGVGGQELLAEIVQELCQPTTVINCAVAMIAQEALGGINAEQKDLLNMAAGCGEKLTSLLNHLRTIVGVPDGYTPRKDLFE